MMHINPSKTKLLKYIKQMNDKEGKEILNITEMC